MAIVSNSLFETPNQLGNEYTLLVGDFIRTNRQVKPRHVDRFSPPSSSTISVSIPGTRGAPFRGKSETLFSSSEGSNASQKKILSAPVRRQSWCLMVQYLGSRNVTVIAPVILEIGCIIRVLDMRRWVWIWIFCENHRLHLLEMGVV